MDRLDAMRLLVRVVERRSFTAAAADLGIPRSTATEAIRALEARLGARLLERTTRQVAPTPEGEAYHARARAILAEIEEAEGALRGAAPAGLLRVDAPARLTRGFLLPRLNDFLAAHPGVDLRLGQGERLVDLLREGVDVVIRAGAPEDSGLVRRSLGAMAEATVASPAYLAAHGTPRSLAELEGHRMVGFVSSRTGAPMPLEFETPDGVRLVTLPCRTMASDADSAAALARLGHGLTQSPRYRWAGALARGEMVEVLPDHPPPPTPLGAYHPQARLLAPRVRVFVDWAAEVFADAGFGGPRPTPRPAPARNAQLTGGARRP
ncbi:MAG: LysR family transcriptional regulator [Pseudomonadota bacterium]|nr:LysR family transcriptional regulator [Pseudomonadota bacterium]